VEGKVYDVVVEILDDGGMPTVAPQSVKQVAPTPKAAAPVASPAPVAVAPVASGSGEPIPSPLAGVVMSINVKVGEAVEEGQLLVNLEAMKMETPIASPKSGVVQAIYVNTGDSVPEGKPLLSIG